MIHVACVGVTKYRIGLLEAIPRELPPMYDPTALRVTILGLEAAPIKAPGEDTGTKLAAVAPSDKKIQERMGQRTKV